MIQQLLGARLSVHAGVAPATVSLHYLDTLLWMGHAARWAEPFTAPARGLFGSPVQPESAMDLAFQAKGEQLGPRTTKKILELFYGNHPVMAACLR